MVTAETRVELRLRAEAAGSSRSRRHVERRVLGAVRRESQGAPGWPRIEAPAHSSWSGDQGRRHVGGARGGDGRDLGVELRLRAGGR